jgi:hypothetical protein
MQRSVSGTPPQAKLATLSDLPAKQAWGKSAMKSQIFDLLISTANLRLHREI